MTRPSQTVRLRMPEAPAIVAGLRSAALISTDGEVETLTLDAAARRLADGPPPIVCHAPATARRLKTGFDSALDVLELYAFAHPARFCLPTPRGLAEALDLPLPTTLEQEAATLIEAARALLGGLARQPDPRARAIAWAMTRGGWPWGGAVIAALGGGESPHSESQAGGLRVWLQLKEWKERPLDPPSGDWPVEPVEARAKLVRLLGASAEDRPQQAEYASRVAAAFRPRDRAGEPHFVIAEAGTGVGKTLGYLAPASVWAEKNGASVWISTFTRNLQRQLDAELDRVYPDPEVKGEKVVIRKGRENYFCLLNMDEAVSRLTGRNAGGAVALGLMARWVLATRDGDMVGGDFPAWLSGLLGRGLTVDLTDTRGECIYSACPHYHKCFVERSIRRARRAEIVVANHALVLIQAALGGDESAMPVRYVFDEGHHLFDAADAAFSAHLTGLEAADLRRWLLGAESRTRSRSRGLKSRVDDLLIGDAAKGAEMLDEVLRAARALPGPGWMTRVAGGTPTGPAEAFLAAVRQQVLARDPDGNSPYGLEAHPQPPVPGLLEAAEALDVALARLRTPVTQLVGVLLKLLDTEAESLDTSTRGRIESVCRSLERRGAMAIDGWRGMLASLGGESPEDFVDWFALDREGGREIDVGMHRHWVDPMRPFAAAVAEPAHGLVVTSATLRDGTSDTAWKAAELRSGVHHVDARKELAAIDSPFDYVNQTRVLVVTDVGRADADTVAAAYRDLFLAAGGGALGLFTAIARLRAVHGRIAPALDAAGMTLLAQHIDAMDTGTLIDIFRAEENSCLLGTDAVRDGVDVPGTSLRLIVFDRVPWPRPTILHRARKDAFGGSDYDGMLARLRLKQAYGRLIRRATDRGVFVLLDRAMPSRFANAFPNGVALERVGLAEAIAITRTFLAQAD